MFYPLKPRPFSGGEPVAYWENFLSDEQLENLLSLDEWNQLLPGIIFGDGSDGQINKKTRNSKVAWLAYDDRTADLWETLSEAISKVNAEFFRFDLTGMYEHLQLSVYDSTIEGNGHYNWHIDMGNSTDQPMRKLSMAMLLSDTSEFSGGELQVKTSSDEVLDLEQQKGRAWFFPSWTLHRVAPVTSGVRKSLVVWIGGPPFK